MEMRIAAITDNKSRIEYTDILKAEVFSGVMAGICYMSDNYDNLASKQKAAFKRYNNTIKNGHHSISEHVYITVILENASKAIAMILNSLQAYNTSEKSGRYTNLSEGDVLYKKWYDIFLKKLGDSKLAMENARLVLSVFKKATTFAYTASLSRWNYIADWCDRFISIKDNYKADGFYNNLLEDIILLRDFIKKIIKDDNFVDTKNQEFDFILNYVGSNNPVSYLKNIPDNYFSAGATYTASYEMSFAALAQAERHRTLKYNIIVPDVRDIKYYIPECIQGTEYEKEWLIDLSCKNDEYPQAAMVKVIERGDTEKFLLKCTERICVKAQTEIRYNTIETFKKFIEFSEKESFESEIVKNMIQPYLTSDGYPKTKCSLISGGCQAPCGEVKNLIKFIVDGR